MILMEKLIMNHKLYLQWILRLDAGGATLNYDPESNTFIFWTDTFSGDRQIVASGDTLELAIENYPLHLLPKIT